jgi:hypothetical protein
MWKPSVLDIIMCVGSVKYCVVFVGNEPIKIHEQWTIVYGVSFYVFYLGTRVFNVGNQGVCDKWQSCQVNLLSSWEGDQGDLIPGDP